MEYRRLGRTELKVSLIGMGGIPLQRSGVKEAQQALETALQEGVNFFDTARSYTDSEEKMGRVLSNNNSYIATKSFARTGEEMKKELEKSFGSFLGQKIDLYQLHNVKSKEQLETALGSGGAVEELQKSRKEGLIDYIGISGHVVEVLIEAVKTGKFDTVQFPLSIIEQQTLDELIPLARELDIGIIAMKPLAGGALGRYPEAALKWLLDLPVATIIPGADSVEQVKQNTGVVNYRKPFTQEEKVLLEEEAQSIGQNFCRRCEYCQPCSSGISISSVFVLDTYWTRYGLQEWAQSRYKEMAVNALDCIECRDCEERCPYDLPIVKMLKESHRKLSGEED